jgi:N,N-dimethylformamidase beta subunit-like, C-terminal
MSNQIVPENKLPGSPDTQWDLSGPGSGNIAGFATDISVNLGETVNFKINTNSNNYRIDIYRLGYYQGNGARLVTTLQVNKATNQPAPFTDSSIGFVDCGKWVVSASWTVPANLVSGVYLAHLVRMDGTSGENHIPFIVRDDQTPHDIVFQTSDTTWHAYNGWGGYSLYGGGATLSSDGRAYKVSYNRPIATRDGVGTYAGPHL